jgi:hypothetical protein
MQVPKPLGSLIDAFPSGCFLLRVWIPCPLELPSGERRVARIRLGQGQGQGGFGLGAGFLPTASVPVSGATAHPSQEVRPSSPITRERRGIGRRGDLRREGRQPQ